MIGHTMKDAIYIKKQTAVLNFSTFFPTTSEEFLSSDGFRVIAKHYLLDLQKRDQVSFNWLVENNSIDDFMWEYSVDKDNGLYIVCSK